MARFLCTLLAVLASIAVATVSAVPPEWADAVAHADMLYSNAESSVPPTWLPSLGNGFLATVVGSDALYAANVFNGDAVGANPSHRARIASPINFVIQGAAKVTDAALDLRHGAYLRRYAVTGGNFEQMVYFHRSYYHTVVVRYSLLSSNSLKICLKNNPGAASADVSVSTLTSPLPQTSYSVLRTFVPEISSVGTNTLYLLSDIVPDCFTLEPSASVVEFLFVVHPDSSGAIAEYQTVKKMAVAERYAFHVDEWAQLWSSGMWVDNLDLARVINSSLFYILISARGDLPYSTSPGSLASNAYNGHTFWDTETWQAPTIAVLYPDIADAMMAYRKDRIPEAQSKAASYQAGYIGAMFPWESAQTGVETCPTWAATGLLEQHISSDIVLLAATIYNLRGDNTFLQDVACPIASQVADFWVSRSSRDAQGSYHIVGVIPPDEYAVNVTDSVYTNAAAVLALRWAHDQCASFATGVYSAQDWLNVADNLVVIYDASHDRHPEYTGYTNETVKQADVVLLGFPLNWPMSETTKLNDLEFYAGVTDSNGPAMTWSAFAIAYLDLNMTVEAAKFFQLSYANSHVPYGVWTETPTGGSVNFITGAGGFLQGVMFGYGGIRVEPSRIVLRPQLPSGVSHFTLGGMKIYDASITVEVDATQGVSVRSDQPTTSVCFVYGSTATKVTTSLQHVAGVAEYWSLARCPS
jgi:trehalose/maltose hydrolase-like predicted phosphorylase